MAKRKGSTVFDNISSFTEGSNKMFKHSNKHSGHKRKKK